MAVRKTFRFSPDWVRARWYHLFAPLAALLAMALLAHKTSLLEELESLTVNLRFHLRAPFDPPADTRLLLVGIDQKSIDMTGSWPWPRIIEAQFLDTIVKTGVNPHTVAFDILFTDDYDKYGNLQKSTSGANFDQVLGDSAGRLASVVTGALSFAPDSDPVTERHAEDSTQTELLQPGPTQPLSNIRGDVNSIIGSNVAILPVAALRKQSLFGFVNDEPSRVDRIRRTLPLLERVRDKVYPSFSLQVLCQMLNVDPDKVEVDLPGGTVTLKNSSGKTWKIPINSRGEFAINYRRESGFRGVSFISLFGALAQHNAHGTLIPPEADIDNKTLVIGQTATGLTDLGPTPLQSESPLVYVHLNAINNVLQHDYLRFVPWPWVVAGWLVVTWISLLRLKVAPLGEAITVPFAAMILYTIFAFAIFWEWSLQIALAWPVLGYVAVNFGGVVLRWREEQRGREYIKQLFSRMLSPEVMDHLLAHPENLKLGGSERDVTILFSDIRDYTTFSEGLAPAEVVRHLNVYFERMVACIQENRGTLHKYIGDAIMAAWGDVGVASQGLAHDAQNAVRAALMMRRDLRVLNAERAAGGHSALRIGIGLNHDRVLVGLIGASSRSEFTVMGDGVNIASRLEGVTKEFRTDLAVSESVRRLLGDAFLVRRLGYVQLKGKTTPTMVYDVLAEKNQLAESALSPETVTRYEEAFDHFLARRFAEAETGFLACQGLHPDDYPVKKYLDAVRRFGAGPPPPDWDGRIVMETK